MRTLLVLLAALSSVRALAQEPAPTPSDRWAILTAITVPQPLAVGVLRELASHPDLAYYVEGGWFRFGFGNNRAINDWSVSVGVRYRPRSDWFVTGLSFGYRRVGLTADISGLQAEGEPIASRASLDLNALFFGIFVGGQWPLSSQVSIGFDLGAQLAVVPWGDVTIDSAPGADNTDLSVDASRSMRRIANLPIPQIALVRVIWYL